jgi:hypothetical protein
MLSFPSHDLSLTFLRQMFLVVEPRPAAVVACAFLYSAPSFKVPPLPLTRFSTRGALATTIHFHQHAEM